MQNPREEISRLWKGPMTELKIIEKTIQDWTSALTD
jgi:hypothetical protein